jgi:hypothetical protein
VVVAADTSRPAADPGGGCQSLDMGHSGTPSDQPPEPSQEEATMKPFYKYAGIAASFILIAFGIGAAVMGLTGRSDVRDQIAREQIVGTPDMSASVANKQVKTGAQAKAFADGMRKHTLEATAGQTYSEMGRYLTAAGKPTNDEKAAAIDKATGKPVENGARNIWVTETALTTALNTSYFAENVANFAIVMGIALLLTGIGFLVLVLRLPIEAADKARAAIAHTREPAVTS